MFFPPGALPPVNQCPASLLWVSNRLQRAMWERYRYC
ncbi:hypothetical protein PM8797T_21158 [Gimesia maris DSM 8797]|nr:hypothetical protein PM8797T_21158 [Gimesia maris DSM 8797]